MSTQPHLSKSTVRDLVIKHGWNATAYQILNQGFEWWGDDQAIVGFVRARRPFRLPVRGTQTGRAMWIAAGAPVCPPEALEQTATAFERHARTQGAGVCWFGADRHLWNARQNEPGFSTLVLGAQPVWVPDQWSDILDSRRSIRQQRNRARNKGVRIEQWSEKRAASLRPILDNWLSRRGLPALSFLTKPDILPELGFRRLFVARHVSPVAYLVLTPVPARNGWLVEQIVQHAEAPNGTATLLLDAAFHHAIEQHSDYLTLGLSPLSSRAPLSHPAPSAPIRFLLAWIRAHGRRFYNFQGLEHFKAKFRPDRWDPIVACTNEPRPSLGTLYAIADAFSGARSPIRLIGKALGSALVEEGRRLRVNSR